MAQERLAPDALLDQTGLTGAFTDIDDDPDSPDASWLTTAANTNTVCRTSFPTPASTLTAGAGLQEFRVQVRKTAQSTDPTCVVELYEAGVLVSTVVASTTISSTTGVVLSGTWDATGRTAASIECRVVGTVGGGAAANRASVEVGAVEWNAAVNLAATIGQVTETDAASVIYPPGNYVTGVSGLHFTDTNGDPILFRGYVIWGLLMNAGRWNGGDWRLDLENAVAGLADMGVNVLYTKPIGDTSSGGVDNTGSTWDGVAPFVGGDPATFNDTFWERTDYCLDLLAANGIAMALSLGVQGDMDSGILSGFTTTDWSNYGTSLAARYKTRTNLLWMIGADYFDNQNTGITAAVNAIRTEGDTHLFGVENYAETTSRFDLETSGVLNTGTDNSDFNAVYSYNVTYLGIESAHAETSPLPVLWADGHFDTNSSADRKVMRDLVWWALSSGACGSIYGSEGVWSWQSGSLSNLTTGTFPNTDQPNIWNSFAGLSGWERLLPDTDSSLVTGGRGTKGDYVTASGGSGGVYDASDTQDTYVTASVTADGTLAVIYCPVSTTITVNDTEMVAGYTATWIDPASGATTSETVGSSYTTPGANSLGGNDWVLVLEGSAATPVNQVTETDTALTITPIVPQVVAVGQVTETDSAQSMTAVQEFTSELDEALPITAVVSGGGQTVAVGQASETDTAQAFSSSKVLGVTQATETDTALAVTVSVATQVGQASETDTAQAVGVSKAASLTQAVETDTALTVSAAKTLQVGQASETDTSQALSASKTATVSQAVETDTPLPITTPGEAVVPVGQAVESSTAQALGKAKVQAIGQASETSTTTSVGIVKLAVIGQASETNTALAMSGASSGFSDLDFIALAPVFAHGTATLEMLTRTAAAPTMVERTATAPEMAARTAGEPTLAHGDTAATLGHGDSEATLGHGQAGAPTT